MSLHLPSRRILGTAPTIIKTLRPTLRSPSITSTPVVAAAASPILLQIRHASRRSGPKRSSRAASSRPNNDIHKSVLGDFTKTEDRKKIEENLQKNMMSTRLESQSIFDEEFKTAPKEETIEDEGALTAEQKKIQKRKEAKAKEFTSVMGASLLTQHTRSAIDPDPRSRRRWERKMVLRNVERALNPKGRETRQERIKRTERELASKSPWLATSYKKLGMLARQISGKTLEEARTQMKFSKKKFAREVLYELNLARDKAIVERGMGLGKVTGEYVPGETKKTTVRDERHGKWVNVVDPTRMYIHEAWVNRGPWRGKLPSFRARGRVNILQLPQASITIRLKEEKSRIREFEEKKAKAQRRAPWVHLPNRPITAQRPFYSW